MEKFHEAVKQSVNALVFLSSEFEKLETEHSDLLSEGYPFSQDLREVVSKVMEWQYILEERRR